MSINLEISFYVPCLNEEENILKTINTIVTSADELKIYNYEILVFNDCSTDKTEEIVLNYISQNITFFKDYRQKSAPFFGPRPLHFGRPLTSTAL